MILPLHLAPYIFPVVLVAVLLFISLRIVPEYQPTDSSG